MLSCFNPFFIRELLRLLDPSVSEGMLGTCFNPFFIRELLRRRCRPVGRAWPRPRFNPFFIRELLRPTKSVSNAFQYRVAGFNPFFIRELLRLVKVEGTSRQVHQYCFNPFFIRELLRLICFLPLGLESPRVSIPSSSGSCCDLAQELSHGLSYLFSFQSLLHQGAAATACLLTPCSVKSCIVDNADPLQTSV